jgi:hypothetical protein
MDYISCLKNTQLEIVKCGFDDVEKNFMTSILIKQFPLSYKNFLETLQITGKIEKQTISPLSDLLVQHDNFFGKKKTSREDLTNSKRGEISRGRCTYNESTSGRDTYTESTRGRGRGRYNENSKGRRRFNNQEHGDGHSRSQERGNNNLNQ